MSPVYTPARGEGIFSLRGGSGKGLVKGEEGAAGLVA